MCFTLCEFLLIVWFVTEPTYVEISVVSDVKCRPQVVLKPIYAYQSLVNRGEACNFEGWVGFGTGWAGLIGHQLGWVGPLKTHGLRAKFWARLWPDPVLVIFSQKLRFVQL